MQISYKVYIKEILPLLEKEYKRIMVLLLKKS